MNESKQERLTREASDRALDAYERGLADGRAGAEATGGAIPIPALERVLAISADAFAAEIHRAWCIGVRVRGGHGPFDTCQVVLTGKARNGGQILLRVACGQKFPPGVNGQNGEEVCRCPNFNPRLVSWGALPPEERSGQAQVAEAIVDHVKKVALGGG